MRSLIAHTSLEFRYILLVFGLLVCWRSSELPYGGIHDPGPGFLPLWLGVLLSGMALTLFLTGALRTKGSKPLRDLWEANARWGKILLALVFLFLFAVLLDTAGSLVLSFLFLAGLFRFIDPQPWKSVIGWALAGSVGFYFVFEVWLRLRFPKGILGF